MRAHAGGRGGFEIATDSSTLPLKGRGGKRRGEGSPPTRMWGVPVGGAKPPARRAGALGRGFTGFSVRRMGMDGQTGIKERGEGPG